MDVIKIPRKETHSNVTINAGLCKGCGLCVKNCPKDALKIGDTINLLGYKSAVVANPKNCSCCGSCYYMCPEPAAISIKRNLPALPAKPKEKRAA